MGEPDDQLIKLLMDDKLADIVSTLIAKLERLAFDDTRTGVFRTQWGRGLFATVIQKLMPNSASFDIDEWYRQQMKQAKPRTRRDIDPSAYVQPIEVNWLCALLELEMQSNKKGSLLRVFHNVLELEDKSHEKLATFCKKENQYNFIGINKPPAVGQKLLTSNVPPGGKEDLLKHAFKN